MARSRFKYLCIKEDSSFEIIASQDIYKILDEFEDDSNPYTSIIRQDLYSVDWDNCLVTTGMIKSEDRFMTNKEAILNIDMALSEVEWQYPMDYAVAFKMAIKALEQQSSDGCDGCKYIDLGEYREPCLSCKNNYILKWKADK